MLEGSPAAQLTPVDPRRLGKWDVESRIGSGGMGVVYRARCGEEVAALKVVRPGLLDDPQVAARFEREAELLRTVHDDHISRFLDADISGDPAWLATEYVAGPNLRDAVTIWGPLSRQRWWQLARGLAQALAVLEIHGITHRDMKPANVIISDRGPVLIDFGIAHPEDAASLTATGIVTGSPGWLSPEQVNLKDVTAAADVFSLGSLLAFAATGRPPFGQGATVAVLMAIQRNEPDLDGVDRTRAALLRRMLAKEPKQRPTAREVLEIARTHHDGSTVSLSPPDDDSTQPIAARVTPAQAVPQPTRERRRWRRPVAVVASLLVAVGLGYVGYNLLGEDGAPGTQQTQSVPQQPTVADAPPAPASDQLSSDDWLLSRYSISQDGGNVVVNGTVVNNAAEPRSADLTVYYYIDGSATAVATGSTGEVPAGGSAEVSLTSDDAWRPGQPVLLVEAG